MTTAEFQFLLAHLSCQVCGGPFPLDFPSGQLRFPSHGIPTTCSRSCRGKHSFKYARAGGFGVFKGDKRPGISEAMRGEKHPFYGVRGPDHFNYKAEANHEGPRRRVIEMGRLEYRQWRTAVFERDDYTCQLCGQHGGKLRGHHVYSWEKYPELRYDVDNGMTLCHVDHNDVRRIGAFV